MSSPLPQKRSRALSPFRGAAPCETHAPCPPARTVPEARFRRAMGLAGVEPEQCWFIGDDVRCDIEGAARAGIYPVWYKSPLKCTYKPESKTPPQCEFTRVESWDELGDILRGLI